MIYFIKSESGHVKIGFTDNNVESRLIALQCGNPFKLTLLKMIDGDIIQERLLHFKFKKYRCIGEWFLLNDKIMEFIDSPYKLTLPKIKKEDKFILYIYPEQTKINQLIKLFGNHESVANELQISLSYVYMLQRGEKKASPMLIKLIDLTIENRNNLPTA